MTETERLSGRRKVAALMIALGAERAAQLLRQFNETEIEAITREIVRLERLPDGVREKVLKEAVDEVGQSQSINAGADFARELLMRALPSNRAADLLQRSAQVRKDRPFGFIAGMDLDQVAAALENEHPQTIALVLSHLPPDTSGRLLVQFEPGLRADITSRLAVMAPTSPERVRDVETVLKRRLQSLEQQGLRKAGGVEHVVAMLGSLDSRSERAILDVIAERNPELAAEVRKNMFLFEDIKGLDDQSIRRLVTDVRKELPVALRAASEELKQRIFANLSQRAGQQLRDEVDLRGPTRVRDVEEAQGKVVEIARRLAEEGQILIPRGREDIAI